MSFWQPKRYYPGLLCVGVVVHWSVHVACSFFISIHIKRMMNEDIQQLTAQEWAKISQKLHNKQSLFSIYERDTKLYQRWRRRFMQFGYIQPTKQRSISPKTYARQWRAKHPGAAKKHCHTYWMKRLGTLGHGGAH